MQQCVKTSSSFKGETIKFLKDNHWIMNDLKMILLDHLFYIPIPDLNNDQIKLLKDFITLKKENDNDDDFILDIDCISKDHFIKLPKKSTDKHPRLKVIDILLDKSLCPNWNNCIENNSILLSNWKELVSSNWVIYGNILTLKRFPYNEFIELQFSKEALEEYGFAFSKIFKVKSVVGFSSGIVGELRTPSKQNIHLLWYDKKNLNINPFETIHQENNVKYCFDISKIMFSPGNGTERKRALSYFKEFPLDNEKYILDMFSGIGYFSLPMSISGYNNGNIEKIICIEKNPNSCFYLRKNFEKNNLPNDFYEIYEGDNRYVGDKWIDKIHRISMGYLPETYPFLPRAFYFLEKQRYCFLHYHYLYEYTNDLLTLKKHIDDAIITFKSEYNQSTNINYEIISISTVKTYAPNVIHAVGNIKIFIELI